MRGMEEGIQEEEEGEEVAWGEVVEGEKGEGGEGGEKGDDEGWEADDGEEDEEEEDLDYETLEWASLVQVCVWGWWGRAHTHTRMHACTHTRMHAHTRMHTHACMHAHKHTHTCTHTHAYARACMQAKVVDQQRLQARWLWMAWHWLQVAMVALLSLTMPRVGGGWGRVAGSGCSRLMRRVGWPGTGYRW